MISLVLEHNGQAVIDNILKLCNKYELDRLEKLILDYGDRVVASHDGNNGNRDDSVMSYDIRDDSVRSHDNRDDSVRSHDIRHDT